jgi:hypothetical protein
VARPAGGPAAQPTVTVGAVTARRGQPRADVAVRCRELAPADVTALGGVAVTALPLTVLEAAVALGPDGPPLLDEALRERVRIARGARGAPADARHPGLGARGPAARRRGRPVRRRGDARARRLLRATGTAGWVRRPARARTGRGHLPAAGVSVLVSGWAQPLPPPAGTSLRYCWHDLVRAA